MTEQTSTTLTGWLQPGGCYFCGPDLHLNVHGTFAGEEARITICLADAHRHGVPAAPDDRITRQLGNWLELSGTLEPSPLDDADRDPEYTGDLTVRAIDFSHRVDARATLQPSPDAARKTITALFPAARARVAVALPA
jgi:hypothetical protein